MSRPYAYGGLELHSDFDLPFLLPGDPAAVPDVFIRRDEEVGTLEPSKVEVSACAARIVVPEFGCITVHDGTEVVIRPSPAADAETIGRLVLGPVLALVLHQRGRFVLHASAVVVDGAAVAFLGNSGQGKSTLAAFFYRRGHALITDDVLPLDIHSSPILAQPTYPAFKLSGGPATADAASGVPDADASLESLHPATKGFPGSAVPLGRLFVLERGERTGIKPLGDREAVVELIRHTYGIHLGCRTEDEDAALHLRECAQLVRHVEVARLVVETDLSALPRVAALVASARAESGELTAPPRSV